MSEKEDTPDYDVIIIGAGLYGIQAARTYLEIHPKANLCILESDDVIGGTWSSKRIYDAFWTQTPVGMAEISDQPMTPPPLEDQYYGFFPAKYVTEYLESYVDSHIYDSVSLRERIKFDVNVQKIEKIDKFWVVFCHDGVEMKTTKLIDATGMTSQPNIPNLPGKESFQGRILHHKEFGELGDLKNIQGHHFAVLGGGKSAADVAYSAAKVGKVVSWIIREEGNGPAALLSCKGKGPYANSNDSFYTRLVASFLPNPFSKDSYLSKFLHGSRLGTWIVRRFWDAVDRAHRKEVDYQREEGKCNRFYNLEPDTPLFWQNDSSGINQRPDFYTTIASKVCVYRQDIERISPHSISLAAGTRAEENTRMLPVDILVLCTGWSPISQLYSRHLAKEMGLPVELDKTEERETSDDEQSLVEKQVLNDFQTLRFPPKYRRIGPSHTPCRLYRLMVPVIDTPAHSIVFLGKMVVGNNFRAAEIQALWAVAYLDGKLQVDSLQARQEIDETLVWCRKRYLNKGHLGSWLFFDTVDYSDWLLSQLGLKSHRQGGFLRHFLGPCRAVGLRNLIEEYKALRRS
ncbi:hypothetical protein ACLMJK_000776 [Lecanora helva]